MDQNAVLEQINDQIPIFGISTHCLQNSINSYTGKQFLDSAGRLFQTSWTTNHRSCVDVGFLTSFVSLHVISDTQRVISLMCLLSAALGFLGRPLRLQSPTLPVSLCFFKTAWTAHTITVCDRGNDTDSGNSRWAFYSFHGSGWSLALSIVRMILL